MRGTERSYLSLFFSGGGDKQFQKIWRKKNINYSHYILNSSKKSCYYTGVVTGPRKLVEKSLGVSHCRFPPCPGSPAGRSAGRREKSKVKLLPEAEKKMSELASALKFSQKERVALSMEKVAGLGKWLSSVQLSARQTEVEDWCEANGVASPDGAERAGRAAVQPAHVGRRARGHPRPDLGGPRARAALALRQDQQRDHAEADAPARARTARPANSLI